MNGDLTVGDVMTREFVGVSEGDSLAGAADLMVEAGVEGAVVLRGTEAVGLVDARDVLELVAGGRSGGEVSVDGVMAAVASIPVDAPVREAVTAFAADDVRHLVVREGDAVAGTVSEHDVLTALSTMRDVGVEEPPLAVAGGESVPDDRYSTQSVCETCGSLADDLANVNGQLVCVDCRGL